MTEIPWSNIPERELVSYLNQGDLSNMIQVNKYFYQKYITYLKHFREWFFRKTDILDILISYRHDGPNEYFTISYSFKGIAKSISTNQHIVPTDQYELGKILKLIPNFKDFLKRGDIVHVSFICYNTFVYSGDENDCPFIYVPLGEFSPIYWRGPHHFDVRFSKSMKDSLQILNEGKKVFVKLEYSINIGMKLKVTGTYIHSTTFYIEHIDGYKKETEPIYISENPQFYHRYYK